MQGQIQSVCVCVAFFQSSPKRMQWPCSWQVWGSEMWFHIEILGTSSFRTKDNGERRISRAVSSEVTIADGIKTGWNWWVVWSCHPALFCSEYTCEALPGIRQLFSCVESKNWTVLPVLVISMVCYCAKFGALLVFSPVSIPGAPLMAAAWFVQQYNTFCFNLRNDKT